MDGVMTDSGFGAETRARRNTVNLRLHWCYSRPMPRAGWVKPETDQRLSDHISLGVLTRVFPPDLVDRVVADSGRTQVRHRLLPARVRRSPGCGCGPGSAELH